MKFTKKLLATLLVAVMLVSAVVSAGITTGLEAKALNGVGTNTEFQLTKSTYTFGCDISRYNVTDAMDYSRVDFAKMKASGCDFVILRIGVTLSSGHKDSLDGAFLEYYKRARAADMPLGVYFYSRSRTYAEAKQDAQWVINVIESNNMYFEYPIYYDVEAEEQMGGTNPSGVYYSALSNSALETMTLGFMETMEAAGYYPALYCMKSAVSKFSSSFKAKYDIWGAHVKNGEGTPQSQLKYEDPYEYDYSTDWGMWQYSWFGHKKFNGYKYDSTYQQLDVNICYKDYPALMAKYGYNNCSAAAGGNLAQGATVTTFWVDGGRQDINVTTRGYTANLTDGKYSQVGPWDEGGSAANWFGFFKNADAKDDPNTTTFEGQNCGNGLGHIMINLGSAKTVGCVKAYVSGTAGTAPKNIDVYAGTSEYALEKVGTMNLPVDAYGFAVLNLTNTVSAQYVRLDVTVDEYWALLNEVQIFAESQEESGTVTPPTPGPTPVVEDWPHDGLNATVVDTYNEIPLGSETPSAAGCVFGNKLTDGKITTAVSPADGSWYAIQRYWNCDNEESGVGELTLDLGATYAIEAVKLHLGNTQMAGPTAGIITAPAPAEIKVTLLDDKKATVASGTITPKADEEIVYWSDAYVANGAKARYVVINITVGGDVETAFYALLDEIAVFGAEVDNSNIAFDQTVVSAPEATRGYIASLTDGVAHGAYPTNSPADWFGIFTNSGTTEQNCPSGVADIVIDLGTKYDLTKVMVHIGVSNGFGAYEPISVVASVANAEDGTYTEIGTLSGTPEEDGGYWISVDATGAKGRYLKITVTVDTESEYGFWAMLNEVKAYGTENTAPDRLRGDVNNDGVVDKKDYAALKRYCFDTVVLDSESLLAADVNNDGVVDKKDYAALKRYCFETWVIETPYI